MGKRKSIGKKVRFEIFKRDHFTCQYCGRTPPMVILEIDHITPVAAGGDNDEINLLTACFDCNSGKGDRGLESHPPALAEQIEREKERTAQVAEFNAFLMAQRAGTAETLERLGHHWFNPLAPPHEQDYWTFAGKREVSLKTFLKWLTEAEILECMDIAQGRMHAALHNDQKAFRYFCGCCWNTIRQKGGGV